MMTPSKPIKSWKIDLNPEKTPETPRPVAAGIISDPDAWDQYMSHELYLTDKAVRDLLYAMADSPDWTKQGRGGSAPNRKFTASMIFERLNGRKYTPQDRKEIVRIKTCCRYYANRIIRNTKIGDKFIKHKDIYVFPKSGVPKFKGEPKLPYSLKLRFEYLRELGIMPSSKQMTLDKDELLDWNKEFRARSQSVNRRSIRKTQQMREVYNVLKETREHSDKGI